VQLGSKPNLGIHTSVSGEIGGTLVRNAFDRITVLHDTARVGEGFEIEHQVIAFRATMKPCGQVVHIGRRKVLIPELGRELDHRCRP
jgi:hypothetical protein